MAFLRNVLATIVGIFLFFLLLVFLLGGLATALSSGEEVVVEDNTVLYFNLNGNMRELAPEESIERILIGDNMKSHGLINMLRAIRLAKTDDRIKGLYLEHRNLAASLSAVKELRDALVDFKTSGKFVYSFSEFYSEGDYYLAAAANKTFLHPEGAMEFNGLSANVMFLKGMLDKLDIEPEIFRVGEYKSAIEPLIRKDLSKENRAQTTSLLASLQGVMLGNLSKDRNKELATLERISDQMLVKFPEDAKEHGLITDVYYVDQVKQDMKGELGIDEDEKIEFLPYATYESSIEEEFSMNRIAVVVADGEIVMGKGDDGQIGAHKLIKELEKVRNNDKIKSVVVRINSPGGSALASDIIWRELELIKEKKPLIASMSGVAASGGYYMAAAADEIVAEPSTITGSIGVFGLLANIGKFMEDKLGITFDQVKTGEYSDFPAVTRSLTSSERAIMQQGVDRVYETFLNRVDKGRPLDKEAVAKVAKGRVWTGKQALDNGLVDRLGGLQDAIDIAAAKAGVQDDYTLTIYPKPKGMIEQLLEDFEGGLSARFMKREMGIMAPYFDKVKSLEHYMGIQTRLPFDITID